MADLKEKKVTKSTKVKAVKPEVKVVKTGAAKKVVEKKTPSVKEVSTPVVAEKVAGVSVAVLDLLGKSGGKITLPGEMFAAKINPTLMAQVLRVYAFSQRQGHASTKTRGEVSGTTKKVYSQKGTGRARHGAKKAPIFVGGGITFGPRPRGFNLEIPKKMRRRALFSALTSLHQASKVMVFDATGATGKTKEMTNFLKGAGLTGKKITFVTTGETPMVSRAGGNLEGVSIIRAENLHTYAVLNSNALVFVKDSIEVLKKTFLEKTIEAK